MKNPQSYQMEQPYLCQDSSQVIPKSFLSISTYRLYNLSSSMQVFTNLFLQWMFTTQMILGKSQPSIALSVLAIGHDPYAQCLLLGRQPSFLQKISRTYYTKGVYMPVVYIVLFTFPTRFYEFVYIRFVLYTPMPYTRDFKNLSFQGLDFSQTLCLNMYWYVHIYRLLSSGMGGVGV